jgi:hypothetical protein
VKSSGWGLLVIVLAAVAAGCGAQSSDAPEKALPAAIDCPAGVLFRESRFARVSDVLAAAQRVLARDTINSQGRIYRLTPKWAPIDFIAQVNAVDKRVNVHYNRLVAGSLAIERAGAAECGALKTNASWAIHYDMPASTIAGTGVYAFFVKTRGGWRFWGQWCGASQSAAWRNKNCF